MQSAGKPQRKFVLLGKPGRKVAAVIVEANKFAFIYNSVQSDAPNGIHQVTLLRARANLVAAVCSEYASPINCLAFLSAGHELDCRCWTWAWKKVIP